ncbi:hypothetical protein [Micromonospora sp. NPDC007220]|uniref:hypothetical protein n=1 Tax=Micromonospora sp. NPDC007220 TaxID=3154318 RepID=UPI0033F22AC2
MTVGFWHEEAQRALRAATSAVTGRRAADAGEINALMHARADLYHQMARITELLVGGRPVAEEANRATATLILGRQGQNLTRLYVGLRAAAMLDEDLPPAPAITAGPAGSLRRAADALGVIGDIIAGHLPFKRRSGTPEGRAIRAGGGVQGALADLARLTVEAIQLDRRLPAWLNRGGPLAHTYRSAAEAARWTSNSQLGLAAAQLVAAAKLEPDLRELDTARSPLRPAPAVDTVDTAIAAIRAARTWLWLHPEQVTGVHLQTGTQLGLAVHVLTTGNNPDMIGGWRQAAIAAADLRATPASGPAQDAAAEIGEALRWTRSLLVITAQEHVHQQARNPERLVSEMRLMAATMHRGLRAAVRHCNLFVRADTILHRPAGSLVYRAAPRWRPATNSDDLVRDLSRALWQTIGQNAHGDTAGMIARVLATPPHPNSMSPTAVVTTQSLNQGQVSQDSAGPAWRHTGNGHLSRLATQSSTRVACSEAVEDSQKSMSGGISID